jgi:hypothetical protein
MKINGFRVFQLIIASIWERSDLNLILLENILMQQTIFRYCGEKFNGAFGATICICHQRKKNGVINVAISI